MTAVVSYNLPLGFFSGKWSAVGAKTSFARALVLAAVLFQRPIDIFTLLLYET